MGRNREIVTPWRCGMALSMEEERILTGIASQLGREDPKLAQRLADFGRLRRRRRMRIVAAIIISVLVVALIVGAALVAVSS
jgi:Protein of unknown function (DUF3040)